MTKANILLTGLLICMLAMSTHAETLCFSPVKKKIADIASERPWWKPFNYRVQVDDGPTSDATLDYTGNALNALRSNPAQSPALSTFFIQPHVSNRLPGPRLGTPNAETALSDGHTLGIHTGFGDAGHVLHTDRVDQDAYDVDGDQVADGFYGLESDLIAAKAVIENLNGGTTPKLVRAVK